VFAAVLGYTEGKSGEPCIGVHRTFQYTLDTLQSVLHDHLDFHLEYISFFPVSGHDFLLPKRILLFPPESREELIKSGEISEYFDEEEDWEETSDDREEEDGETQIRLFPPHSQEGLGETSDEEENGETQTETRKRGREESENPSKRARTS